MTELKPSETTYYIKVEVGRHVPDEGGFYAIFDHKEILTGLDMLYESMNITITTLEEYLNRITKKDES